MISTASEDSLSFVRQLGADEVIDYRTGSFGELARTLDVVFDTVGGSTRDRSWPLLKAGGRLITIAADAEGHSDERIKSAFFIVEPNGKQLAEVAGLLESGELRTFIKAEVALGEAPSAYAGAPGRGSGHGKVVIAVGK